MGPGTRRAWCPRRPPRTSVSTPCALRHTQRRALSLRDTFDIFKSTLKAATLTYESLKVRPNLYHPQRWILKYFLMIEMREKEKMKAHIRAHG